MFERLWRGKDNHHFAECYQEEINMIQQKNKFCVLNKHFSTFSNKTHHKTTKLVVRQRKRASHAHFEATAPTPYVTLTLWKIGTVCKTARRRRGNYFAVIFRAIPVPTFYWLRLHMRRNFLGNRMRTTVKLCVQLLRRYLAAKLRSFADQPVRH